MVIISQRKLKIVAMPYIIVIHKGKESEEFIIKLEQGRFIHEMATYKSFERCHEVMQQIVNAYKEGLPVFELPKE